MTKSRHALIVALAAVGGFLTLCDIAAAAALPPGVDAAAPPVIRTAPGRVAFSVDGGVVDGQDNAGGGGDPAVALPDGGAVALYGGELGHSDLVQIKADGTLDPAFGAGGIEPVPVNLPDFGAGQILRQPDGRLVVVGGQQSSNAVPFPHVVLVRLNPDGSLDPSFGAGGVDVTPIQLSCDCSTVGLRPTGGFVVGGATTQQAGPNVGNVKTQITQWTLAGLTSSGALDPSFGQAGLVTLAGNRASGLDVRVLPDGDTVTTGDATLSATRSQGELARLLPSGAPDPSFDGGTLEALPTTPIPGQILAYPDGTVIVGVDHAIVRYTAAGLPDAGFGTGGIVQTRPATDVTAGGQLLPAAGDGALFLEETGPEYSQGRYTAELIGPSGAIDPSLGGTDGLAFSIPFGGGSSNLLATIHPPLATSLGLAGNTFVGNVVQRPDGSYLFLGGVTVSQPTGEGTGNSIAEFAAAALTSAFKVDTSFGGAEAPLHAKLAVIRQRATTARSKHGIRVTVTLSAPGLARVVIKASGRVVAQNVLPVFGTGPSTLPVELTSFGNQWLKSHPRSRLTASVTARGLLANSATSTAAGSLR
ncbi:MAG TPA: delta-60 repeat domain-containing protein [Solirubrobacteraceae bacterium]